MTAQTPERPVTTWSDEELRKAWGETHVFLGKADVLREFLAALGAVHRAEAREMQREAYNVGNQDGLRRHAPMIYAATPKTCDERYPSLLPKSPPPLVLSTGTWEGGMRGRDRWWWYQGQTTLFRHPETVTASDAEALAKWLREYGSDDERR